MDIIELHKYYWFHDGSIKSFYLDIPTNTAEIQILVTRHVDRHLLEQIDEKDMISCTLKIMFEGLIETSLFDKFPTLGYYLDFKSYSKGEEEVGISFNVHDNSSHTYEADNWVIKAKQVKWEEI